MKGVAGALGDVPMLKALPLNLGMEEK